MNDEQIHRWADEADAGYDVETLRRRSRGRPGRGAEPMLCRVKAYDSAFKHGVPADDAVQAADWPLWVEPVDDLDWPHRELR